MCSGSVPRSSPNLSDIQLILCQMLLLDICQSFCDKTKNVTYCSLNSTVCKHVTLSHIKRRPIQELKSIAKLSHFGLPPFQFLKWRPLTPTRPLQPGVIKYAQPCDVVKLTTLRRCQIDVLLYAWQRKPSCAQAARTQS